MNTCDLQAYMELIVELTPGSVLDAGMIMRRFCLVARRAADCTIPADVDLIGLDFFPERAFPIEQKLYNGIVSEQEFLSSDRNYDFAAMFTDEFPPGIDMGKLIRKLVYSSRYFITYYEYRDHFPEEVLPMAQSITIDQSRYILSRRI